MSELATIASNGWTVVSHGWTAFSLAATLAGVGGIGLIVLAVLATAYLPAWLRRPLIGAGIVLLVGAALYQSGKAKGAHDAFAVDAARTLQQEKDRAEAALREERRQVAAANKVSADDRARADAAAAAAKASAKRLADLHRHLARTPDGACVGDNDARMLRGL